MVFYRERVMLRLLYCTVVSTTYFFCGEKRVLYKSNMNIDVDINIDVQRQIIKSTRFFK